MTLAIGGRDLTFTRPEDFAFCIGSRISVPAQRFQASLRQPSDELWREAEAIKKVEKQLIAVIEETRQSGSPCAPAIRRLNLKMFSNDQNWRGIFTALGKLGDEYGEYQLIGLMKYLQYLGARQGILRLAYVIKNQGREAEQGPAEDMDQGNLTKETVIFDVMQIEDSKRLVDPFQRLPQGQPTRVRLDRGQAMEILLATTRFSLACDGAWTLTDSEGHRFPLRAGRNKVGRSRTNDISLNRDFRNISRCHVVMEPEETDVILLTDLSSHGTFVPSTNLDTR